MNASKRRVWGVGGVGAEVGMAPGGGKPDLPSTPLLLLGQHVQAPPRQNQNAAPLAVAIETSPQGGFIEVEDEDLFFVLFFFLSQTNTVFIKKKKKSYSYRMIAKSSHKVFPNKRLFVRNTNTRMTFTVHMCEYASVCMYL